MPGFVEIEGLFFCVLSWHAMSLHAIVMIARAQVFNREMFAPLKFTRYTVHEYKSVD